MTLKLKNSPCGCALTPHAGLLEVVDVVLDDEVRHPPLRAAVQLGAPAAAVVNTERRAVAPAHQALLRAHLPTGGEISSMYIGTIASKINGTSKGVYLPISKLHYILAVANLLAQYWYYVVLWYTSTTYYSLFNCITNMYPPPPPTYLGDPPLVGDTPPPRTSVIPLSLGTGYCVSSAPLNTLAVDFSKITVPLSLSHWPGGKMLQWRKIIIKGT